MFGRGAEAIDFDYRVIRSKRKTAAIQVTEQGVIVRAPQRMSDRAIRTFLSSHQKWIHVRLSAMQAANAQAALQPLTEDDLHQLAAKAREIIPPRVAYYAEQIGVTYGRITIRSQSTRWGSCSSKGNLNFNCLLMLAPPEVLDSVIVHELCHRKEMNHSDRFYHEVLRVMPDYPRRNAWLKQNGTLLMLRMKKGKEESADN